MKPQATRIEPQKPDESRSELLGCICYAMLFVAMILAVYASPWAFYQAYSLVANSI